MNKIKARPDKPLPDLITKNNFKLTIPVGRRTKKPSSLNLACASDSFDTDIISFLDEYLQISLYYVNPRIRYILVPPGNVKTTLYIENFEKFYHGKSPCHFKLRPYEFIQLRDIYDSLKNYIKILSKNEKSVENANVRIEIMSQLLGMDALEIKQFFDPVKNEFHIFSALDYLITKLTSRTNIFEEMYLPVPPMYDKNMN